MLKVTLSTRGQGLLTGPMDWRVYETIRELPGQKRWAGRNELRFELSRRNLEFLRERLAVDLSDASIEPRLKEIERLEEELARSRQLPAEAGAFAFKTQPYEHQRTAFHLSKDRKVFALLMEMGTGKSKVLIDTLAYLYAQGEITASLIVAPNGVHRQWVDEQLPTHMPDWIAYEAYAKHNQTERAFTRLKQLKDATGLKIFALNVEALQSESGEKLALTFMRNEKVLFALDESTKIKSPGAQRTKRAVKLSQYAAYRRILSGAPVTKGVEDLYSQLRFLTPDVLGFNSFWSFRAHFCVMGGFEQRQIVSYKNMPELLERLDKVSFRVTKTQCLDLPEKVYERRPVELSSEQKRLYDQLKDDLFVQLDSGDIIEAPRAITLLLRLQQVIGGCLPLTEGGKAERVIKENPRVQAAIDLVQEAQGKVIIWARFHADIDWLSEGLQDAGVGHVTYDGRVSNDEREARKGRFLSDPKCRVFVANPAAAGIGLNLTAADTVIYYSNDFNADTRWQSEDRCHRIGQRNTVTYIDLVAPGTIDTKILAALKRKKSVADLVTGDLRGLLDGRDEL